MTKNVSTEPTVATEKNSIHTEMMPGCAGSYRGPGEHRRATFRLDLGPQRAPAGILVATADLVCALKDRTIVMHDGYAICLNDGHEFAWVVLPCFQQWSCVPPWKALPLGILAGWLTWIVVDRWCITRACTHFQMWYFGHAIGQEGFHKLESLWLTRGRLCSSTSTVQMSGLLPHN